jgi:hypothetical protein
MTICAMPNAIQHSQAKRNFARNRMAGIVARADSPPWCSGRKADSFGDDKEIENA